MVYGTYSGGITFSEKWWKGKVEDWTSFEIVGRAHGVRFFVRVQETYRNLIESAVYAQFPNAEIFEIQDYINEFPPYLPNKDYDVWGTDFVLAREDAYPIRTYPEFEEPGKVEEERRIDPIAAMTEVMSTLKESEAIWFQILVRPTNDGWKKKAEALRDTLLGKKKKVSRNWIESLFGGLGEFFANLVTAPFEYPTWGEGAEVKREERTETVTDKRKIIEAIDNKISKLGFESILRFVYIDRSEKFTRSNIAAFLSSTRQFNTLNLNALKPNMRIMTIAKGKFKWLFKKSKINRKKRLLYANYRTRHFPHKFAIFNTEELATLYHFPISGVKSPLLWRIESRRGGPPQDLPIEMD